MYGLSLRNQTSYSAQAPYRWASFHSAQSTALSATCSCALTFDDEPPRHPGRKRRGDHTATLDDRLDRNWHHMKCRSKRTCVFNKSRI
jgi:hypothetical protein